MYWTLLGNILKTQIPIKSEFHLLLLPLLHTPLLPPVSLVLEYTEHISASGPLYLLIPLWNSLHLYIHTHTGLFHHLLGLCLDGYCLLREVNTATKIASLHLPTFFCLSFNPQSHYIFIISGWLSVLDSELREGRDFFFSELSSEQKRSFTYSRHSSNVCWISESKVTGRSGVNPGRLVLKQWFLKYGFGTAASASLEKLLKVQILGRHTSPAKSQTGRWHVGFKRPSGLLSCCPKLENAALRYGFSAMFWSACTRNYQGKNKSCGPYIWLSH